MQISQISSNNLAVGNQPQTTTATTEKPQSTTTDQKTDQSQNSDRVTLSPEAQKLAQPSVGSDGDGIDNEAAESNALKLAEKANNTLSKANAGFDIFA